MSMDVTALPSELLCTPQPLIGFCGLDIQRNAVHKDIWDAFTANRKPERAAIHYKLLPVNYDFPVAKPKRASYEWYHPKGILKRNWMLKHLHVLPAVVVLFQELEWSDTQWTEKQVQCASTVQSLKNALQERNTRLCLVLIQKSAPLATGEDMLAAERATSLTTACGIVIKMLFILPHTEHLTGYTLRLESAFLDMAQSYYKSMAERIRMHRNQLTASHLTLKIRYQFKLGFVAEMRQDFSTALKHYLQAYASLDEIRIMDTNCLEVKTIAGFLNYKITRLMFKVKVPRDSINQFISHVEKYKSRVGFKELLFEHYAWLSAQHSVFAELFCDAIKNGLPALQTQHPGIYFHKAAEYTTKRREAYVQSNSILASPTNTTPPTTLQGNNTMAYYTEFYGIRAVKTGEPASEQNLLIHLREQESNFNHSSVIINMLGQAMAQFKIYKCLRFRKKLAIDMAEEYFKSGDHAKALTLYSLMLPDYRQDRWTTIFSDVLLKTLRCALLSASVTDFVSCSLEALSLKICGTPNDRMLILENLWKVFQCAPPVSQSQNSPEVLELWHSALNAVKTPLQIDLDKMTEVFSVYATFERMELNNDETIKAYLIVKLITDVPIKIHSLALLLTDGVNNFKLPVLKCRTFCNLTEIRTRAKDVNSTSTTTPALSQYEHVEGEIKLEPNIFYQFLFTTDAQQFNENTQLRVLRIEAQMGTDKLMTVLSKSAIFARNAFRHHTRCKDLDDNIDINPICYIAPTFHLVTQTSLEHEQMLVNEYFAIVTTVSNPYNLFLQNVGLSISVPSELRSKVFLTTDISSSRQKLHSQIHIDIGDLPMQSSNTASYYIFSLIEADISLVQKIWYTIDVSPQRTSDSVAITEKFNSKSTDSSPENGQLLTVPASDVHPLAIVSPVQIEFLDESRLQKTREDSVNIKCNLELKFLGRFYTLNRKPLLKIYRGENFLFRVNMEVQTNMDIDIIDTYFICDHNLVQSNYSYKRKKYTNTYRNGDKLEDVIMLRTDATLSNWLTAKEFERSKGDAQRDEIFSRVRSKHKAFQQQLHSNNNIAKNESLLTATSNSNTNSMNTSLNKSLISKIPTNMTIISNTANANALSNMYTAQNLSLSNSIHSDDGKSFQETENPTSTTASGTAHQQSKSHGSRVVFNKAIEAIQATGHCRGFLKGSAISEPLSSQQSHTQANQLPVFGIYCIKWRRSDSKEENESKFVINGLEIEEPPLNIYCTIEEKMFVKMPMTYKIVIKNPTTKVLHLTAVLTITNSDNFICSGHKQLDISIFAQSEKNLVYNLYPLFIGWQELPELTLEYNIDADPSKDDETQKKLLNELVLRAVPRKVFVLPPLKQQMK